MGYHFLSNRLEKIPSIGKDMKQLIVMTSLVQPTVWYHLVMLNILMTQ